MPLPTFDCPVCRNTLTIETVFAHEGVRDAIQALVDAHSDASRLLRPLLGYVGLFAPAKTAMRYERIATILAELTPMIRAAQVERNGRIHAAPMDYWRMAFEEMLARRDTRALRLPLSSHGYLLEIIIGYGNRAEAAAERRLEQQRAGHAGAGSNPNRAPEKSFPTERAPMPPGFMAQVRGVLGKKPIIHAGESNGNKEKDQGNGQGMDSAIAG